MAASEEQSQIHAAADAVDRRLVTELLATVGIVATVALDRKIRDALVKRQLQRVIEIVRAAMAPATAVLEAKLTNELLRLEARTFEIAASTLRLDAIGSLNLTNPQAVDFARTRGSRFMKQFDADLQQMLRTAVSSSFIQGIPPRETAELLRQSIGLTANQTIAIDNYRGFLQRLGARDSLDALPASVKARVARSDSRFLPKRGAALTETRVEKMVDKYRGRLLKERALTLVRTECLPGDTAINAAVVRAIFRRWYSGPMIDIVTRNGRHLSATPNHPVLTRRGWVPAKEIAEGDKLICDRRNQDAGSPRDQNIDAGPASIRQIYDSLATVSIAERKLSTPPDFHGDGIDGEIDVLRANRPLRVGRFAALNKQFAQHVFTEAGMSRSHFCAHCGRLLSIDEQPCLCLRAQRDAGMAQAPDNRPLGNAELRSQSIDRAAGFIAAGERLILDVMPEVGRSTPAADELEPGAGAGSRHTRLTDKFPDGLNVGAGFECDFLDAQSGAVELDDVALVLVRAWSGHVYNLWTPFGYFTASGVYTGNTMAASNEGQLILWKDAIAKRLLDPATARKKFIITRDERLCPVCRAMDGQVRKLDELFVSAYNGASAKAPPMHFQCRCTMGFVRIRAAA